MGIGGTILIAAANQGLGRSIQTLLEVYGFQTALVCDGDQLLESLSGQAFDLVIFGPRFLSDLPLLQLQWVVQSISPQSNKVVLSFNDSLDDFETKTLSPRVDYPKVSADPEGLMQYLTDQFGKQFSPTKRSAPRTTVLPGH